MNKMMERSWGEEQPSSWDSTPAAHLVLSQSALAEDRCAFGSVLEAPATVSSGDTVILSLRYYQVRPV